MTKRILHLLSSPRGNASVSRKLGNAIVEQIQDKYPGSDLVERDLVANPAPNLTGAQIEGLFTPVENRTPEQLDALRYSDEVIAELNDTDIIVIDVPLYEFGIPSMLKGYIDQVVRAGVTFKYNDQGIPEGLVKNKKVYVAFSSGGIYSTGAFQEYDFAFPYLQKILGFIGIGDLSVFRVEGLNVPSVKEHAFQNAVDSIVID